MKPSVQLSRSVIGDDWTRLVLMTWKSLPRASAAIYWCEKHYNYTELVPSFFYLFSSKIYFWGFLRKIIESIEYPQQLSISLKLKENFPSLLSLTSSLLFVTFSLHLPPFFYFSFELFSNDFYKVSIQKQLLDWRVYLDIKYTYTNIW